MNCEGWKKDTLGKLCLKIGSGITPRGGNKVYTKNGTALIRSQNVYDFTFDYSGLVYIDAEQAKKMKGVAVQKNDVLLNITGDSVARCCVIPNEVLPARVNQHVAIVRGDPTKIDARYLLYFLTNPYTKALLFSYAATGGTRKALTKGMIDELKVNIPYLQEQKAIATTLSCLDDKIELNNQINDTLEQMAQAIFKSWFVDFEPFQDGEFEDSELGKIPKGWKVGILENIAEQIKINCRIEEIASGSVYIGLEHIPRKKMILDTVGKIDDVSSNKLKFEKNQIVFGKIRPYFHKVSLSPLSGYCSTDAIVIMAKVSEYLYFTFLHIFSDSFIKYAVLVSHGTKMPRAEWKSLKDYVIVIPPMEIVQNFNETIQPLFKKMMKNNSENKRLSAIRDALLPKLMSGEIRVPVESAE